MKATDLTLIVIALGLLLFAGSFVYPQWSGSSQRQWTEDDAREYQELSRKVHGLNLEFAAQRQEDPDARPSDDFARAADSYLQKKQELEAAQQAGTGVAKFLRYLGMGLVVIGGFCYFATRSGDD